MNKENQHIEFKTSFSDAVIETLCAFANAGGGSVYVGLDDAGKPVANFNIGKETIPNWINEVKNKTQPSIIADIQSLMIQGKEVVCLRVNEFPVKPVSFKGRYYKRVNNSNHQLSAIEITNLSMQSLQLSWDSYPAQGKSFDDLDVHKVTSFFEKVNARGRFKLEGSWLENLQKLKLVGAQGITNAAWLLFAKENTGYNVHLGRFKTPSTIIDDRMLNGTLFEAVEETMRYLIGQIKVAFEIKGMPTQRTEIFEYPLPALREIVLNTIIHGDYLSPIDIQIKIYDQKITFYNPGTLYGNLTVEELKKDNYQANARNKLLAEAFYLTGDIEKYGSGFIRIRKELKEYPTMKMEFSEIPNGFLASLSYTKQKTSLVHDNVTEDVTEDVTDNRRNAIVELIKKNNKITTTEIANEMGVVRRTIARDIELLKRSGVIVRVGSDKHGFWEAVGRKEP
ncbi:MAG: putative DNA binding domain-containing protein [Lutibacter sp.]|nr:putative DNA binding domain-containing protein [Lutibacter sp.]